MSELPPVTWLLPVRNGMPFLPATLKSIAEQTYRNHRIIAWDNGSTDGTREEFLRWIPEKIPGIVVHDKPLRLGSSLAAMVEMADTELCARIDGDDINYPDRLERQVKFMVDSPNVGVLGSQCDFIDEDDKPISGWTFPVDDSTIRWRSRWSCNFAHSAIMFRRSLILKAGNYRDCQPHEDTDLWIRVAPSCEFANFPDALIRYRRSRGSVTGMTVNFKSSFRDAAKSNTSVLFPGVSAQDALELWDASFPDDEPATVRLRHFRQLRNSATALARQSGKPDDYFRNTAFFAEQMYHLRRRWLDNASLGFMKWLRQRRSAAA